MIYLKLPEKSNSYYDTKLRYELHEDLIFTFGSNVQGIHGKGAAKEAVMNYGAVYGQGFGLQGGSFGIPTRYCVFRPNGGFIVKTLPLDEIKKYIDEFLEIVLELQEHYFYVTPIGTGYAGYRDSDIAPMFKGAKNCWFPFEWEPYLKD